MSNYQNGKIYKLWSPQGEEDEIYIGSTTNALYKRKNQHKKKSNYCNSKILFEKYNDVRIELIEEYPCNSKAELEKKEGEHIRNNKCLNKIIPCRTNKEYYQDNKQKAKQYYQDNIEKIQEYLKEWREDNKKHIADYSKEYRENNKEQIAEKRKERYENNKEKIKEERKEKITCECGCIVRKNDLARHKKTNKHLGLLND